MSIFTRPDSPPPRQPSPDFIPAPLPSPHLRLRASSSKQSLSTYTPSTPPGLHAPRPHKSIAYARSYDHLNQKSGPDAHERRRRTRSNLTASPPDSPRSLPIPSAPHSADRPHRRCLSSAIPYLSPPPSPTISSPPPPVPPIPSFVLTPPADHKPVHRPQPVNIMPIRLHDLEPSSPSSPSTYISRKQSRPQPSPEKHRSVGMTCMKFFSLRSSKQRNTPVDA